MATTDHLRHAQALWHTLWFHASEARASRFGPDVAEYGDPMFDDDADVDSYNAWQAGRDLVAEVTRHEAVVEAIRAAYASWGIDPPAAADAHRWMTWDAWQASFIDLEPSHDDTEVSHG